jgi:hypothetical protein
MEIDELHEDLCNKIILNITSNRPYSSVEILDILERKYTVSMDNEIKRKIQHIKVNEDSIYGILEQKGFLQRINAYIHAYQLTDKGTRARQLGGIEQYDKWERKENRKKFLRSIDKWILLLFTALGFIVGFFMDMYKPEIKNWLSPKIPNQDTLIKTSEFNKLTDTTEYYKNNIKFLADSISRILAAPK